jgi:hypothetical protein
MSTLSFGCFSAPNRRRHLRQPRMGVTPHRKLPRPWLAETATAGVVPTPRTTATALAIDRQYLPVLGGRHDFLFFEGVIDRD